MSKEPHGPVTTLVVGLFFGVGIGLLIAVAYGHAWGWA